MCLVLTGTHLQLSLPVVLKVLVPETVTSLAVHARFLREAQSIARLTGEHVARIIDVGILPEGVPYSVMEALHGIDLGSEVARRGALMPGEAIDYILQACEALTEAHAHGIVHGELKPGHLFLAARLDGTMGIKVLGFELSRSVQAQPGARPSSSGAPGYMAPEQIKPTEELDGRADVWALGIVLYECITGRHPFQADSVSLMQQAAASESPRPMDAGIPRQLQAVVLRCLEKQRDARFPSIADLAAALAPFARDQRAAAGIVDRSSFMSQGLAGGYEVAPQGQYPIIAPPTAIAASAAARSRQRYAMIGLAALAVSLSGIAAAALIAPGRSDTNPSSGGSTAPAGSSATTPTPSPAASAGSTGQGDSPAAASTSNPAASAGSTGQGDSPAAAPTPPAAVADSAGKPTPAAASTAGASTPPPAVVDSAGKSTPAAASTAGASTPPPAATARAATDSADPARSERARPSDDAPVASAKRPSGERSGERSTDRDPERAAKSTGSKQASAERASEREGAERGGNERGGTDRASEHSTERTSERGGTERAERGTERASAPPSPRGKRDNCESMDVDELMTRAAIQYDAGAATSALSFTRVALGCKQTERMYWLAVMYACAAHDATNARLYFPKVPSNLQSGLETKCQRENLDVRSRKAD